VKFLKILSTISQVCEQNKVGEKGRDFSFQELKYNSGMQDIISLVAERH
jgi:hypothetical protein